MVPVYFCLSCMGLHGSGLTVLASDIEGEGERHAVLKLSPGRW